MFCVLFSVILLQFVFKILDCDLPSSCAIRACNDKIVSSDTVTSFLLCGLAVHVFLCLDLPDAKAHPSQLC
jgi:hypothetical protein